MRSRPEMLEVRERLLSGRSARGVATDTGVPYSTVLRWKNGGTDAFAALDVPPPAPWRPQDDEAYAYLLGLYLGDGSVCEPGGNFQLHIALDLAYPGIIYAAMQAVRAVIPGRVGLTLARDSRCVHVIKGWKRWPEVFPQHGRGRKHERPIVLEGWQQAIVDAHPEPFLRGLIHSDGCRTVNRFTTKLPSGRVAEYAYARYFFSNLSPDIRALFCASCERIGVRWTQSNPRNISVAHRAAVARLDLFIGSKW